MRREWNLRSTPSKGSLKWVPGPSRASHRSIQARTSWPYLFLVGVISDGLFSCKMTGFTKGMVALLPVRGTISLGWAFMAGTQLQCRCSD